jgi:subtilase family serine protease
MDVTGTVKSVNGAFGITLKQYQDSQGLVFRAPDSEPTVDSGINIRHISGLDTHSRLHRWGTASTTVVPNTGTGPSSYYAGTDFRNIYASGVVSNGSGVNIGLLEFDNFYNADITRYENATSMTFHSIIRVLVDQISAPVPKDGNVEVCLDIDMAGAMAPGATIYVFEAPNNSPPIDILNAMANFSPSIHVISSSWSWDGTSVDSNIAAVFKQYAAQGQSFFLASGDDGAYISGAPLTVPDHPILDTPYLTAVGGTALTTSGSSRSLGSYFSESTWNDASTRGSGCTVSNPCNSVSGGGICPTLSLPSWQQGISMAANGGSTSHRNIPDVSMVADRLLLYCNNDGVAYGSGGTSAAAPLWAGFIALVDQQRSAAGKGTLGFVNPAIYSLAKSGSSTTYFHDVHDGSNNNYSGSGKYYAVTGYDLATGWGSPKGALVAALASYTPTTSPSSGGGGQQLIAYPNPFSPKNGQKVTFGFPPHQPGGAKLRVYNRAWRYVADISIGQTEAQSGLLTWDCKDRYGMSLPSGMYWVALVDGSSSLRGKITILW